MKNTQDSDKCLSEIGGPFTMIGVELWECGFNSYELVTLFRIFRRAGSVDGKCFESQQNMATACGFSVSTLRRALASLEAKNVIQRTARFSDNGNQCSSVILICDQAAWNLGNADTPKMDKGVPTEQGGVPTEQGGCSHRTTN